MMGTVKNGKSDFIMRCRLDLDGIVKDVSTGFCELVGSSEQKLIDVSFSQLVKHDERNTIQSLIHNLKQGYNDHIVRDITILKSSGETVDVRVNAVLTRNSKGASESILCFLQNLTKQREILQKLEELEQQFHSLFKNNPHPVYYFDREGNFKGVNDKLVEFTGYSREELLNKGFEEFIVAEDLERTKERFQDALDGKSGQYEIKVAIKSGEIRDIRVTKFPRYSGNEIIGVFGILQDITQDKRAKRKLERSEQRFKSLFERNPNAVYSFDLEGNFIQANEALENLTGYTFEELKELNFDPLVASEDRERVWGHFRKAMKGEPQTYEASGLHKDGHTYFVQVTNLPIYVDGQIVGVFGIAHDITEQKKVNQKVRESEERWHQLVKQNPQPVQVVQDGKIVFINEAGAKYYGADAPEELTGIPIMKFSHPDYKENILNRKEALENGEHVYRYDHKIILLNGEERFIEAHSIPITYNEKPAIQTVIHDITDLKERQREIGESLREKETLLKEIHHRVKNNLAMISSMLELQIMQSTNESAITALRDSQLRLRSIAMIHEKLYQTESLHDIRFDGYLKELVETIQKTYSSEGRNMKATFQLDPITLDVNQVIPCSLIVNEVVVNSYKHAFASRGGGQLNISLVDKNPLVELQIADNGEGLPDDFDMENHQSLGMTLIQALSDQLNGSMEFSNRTDREGTLFRIQFEKKSG